MRTVYLDELFCLNLVIDYFLLLAAAKICAVPFRRVRYLISACFGGIWSALSLLPACAFLRTPVMHPVLAVAMTLIAFGGERRLWRCLMAFLGSSALFGGAVYAAGLYRGSYLRSGALVRLDLRVLAISFALCWAIVGLVFRRKPRDETAQILPVTVSYHGSKAELRALLDTGNGLYDPMTGRAAMVAEASAVEALFPKEQAAFLSADAVAACTRIPGLRLIPYASVDGKKRLLPVFRPDAVTVDGEARDTLLIAVAPDLGGDGYNAIL